MVVASSVLPSALGLVQLLRSCCPLVSCHVPRNAVRFDVIVPLLAPLLPLLLEPPSLVLPPPLEPLPLAVAPLLLDAAPLLAPLLDEAPLEPPLALPELLPPSVPASPGPGRLSIPRIALHPNASDAATAASPTELPESRIRILLARRARPRLDPRRGSREAPPWSSPWSLAE